MAGSLLHIINHKLEFTGTELLDNLGDAYEALQECYHMLMYLTKHNRKKLWKAWLKGYALKKLPKSNKHLFTYKQFCEELESDMYVDEE